MEGSNAFYRTRKIQTAVTAEEFQFFQAQAAANGLTISTYSYALLFPDRAASPPPQAHRNGPDVKLLARILGELGKLGSNANQIARRANIDKIASPDDLAAFAAVVAGVMEFRTEILRALNPRRVEMEAKANAEGFGQAPQAEMAKPREEKEEPKARPDISAAARRNFSRYDSLKAEKPRPADDQK